ncbi:hypothetical protein BEWA_022990 [Theileria equi strain WA]|uniref:Uncharacterized protein n=1 Tax=Theileria equi strain WA TaxID=1537102 RepID=L0AWR0_THEEQ|nr:hypothetical protein BEWA_022990 [Theileria equi strain WA]AFZ79451.1 hypothetical protein BEWA_022990 [Theileria equi strain WA]|eukprot:XP_004829117.1 hypothetical protein BEWA_022990 [Theileria equi strain WA]
MDKNSRRCRVSDGLIAMLEQPGIDSLPLSLFDIEDGHRLVDASIAIVPDRKMQFLELLVSQLLIKQEGHPIKVHDLVRKKCIVVHNTIKFNPRGFVFYDTPYLEKGNKVYMQNTTRRFFTISFFSIDFWELDPSKMIHVKSIRINGK